MGKKYIVPQVRVITNNAETSLSETALSEALITFLKAPTQRVLLIQGLSGMGKTSALSYIKKYTNQHNIPTKSILLRSYYEDEMRDGIKQPLNAKLHQKKWLNHSLTPRVLMLDSQGELKERKGLINIYQKNQLHHWENLKVIITCRKEIFPSNYRLFFKPNEGELVEWQLLPLNYEQRIDYIRQLLAKYQAKKQYPDLTLDKYMQLLADLPEELAGNPLLMRFCLEGFHLLLPVKQNSTPLLSPYKAITPASSTMSSTLASSSTSLLTGFSNEEQYIATLKSYIPQNFMLEKSFQAQDNYFFNALAQCLNKIDNTTVHSEKHLRMLCHGYYEQNKAVVDIWNTRDDRKLNNDDYLTIQYTAEEYQQQFSGKKPIEGRPHIEGIILCNALNLRGFCIVQILESAVNKPQINFYWINKDSFSPIKAKEMQNFLQNSQVPVLVQEQGNPHYIPLLFNNASLSAASNSSTACVSAAYSEDSTNKLRFRISLTQPLTCYQLYQAALTQHFVYKNKKIDENEANAKNNFISYPLIYAQEMALQMWARCSKTFPASQWALNLFPQAAKSLGTLTEKEKERKLLKGHHDCLLISGNERHHKVYHFKHSSIQEYLVASWVLNYLNPQNFNFSMLNRALIDYKITPLILISDDGILNILLAELNHLLRGFLKDSLNKMILATRFDKTLGPLGAFAITLLNSAGENFNHRDYHAISIRGAILHHGNFYNVLFQQSDLSHVDFQGADLTLANLQGCQMKEVNFGKFPHHQVEKQSIYQFSSDLLRLLVGKNNGEIEVVNLTNNQVEVVYQPDKNASKVTGLWWKKNKSLILSRHDNGKAYLIDQKIGLVIPIDNIDQVVTSLTFNDQKKLIAIGYIDGFIQMLRYKSNTLINYGKINQSLPANYLAFNQKSSLVIGDSNGNIALYHFLAESWQLVRQFKAHESHLYQILFTEEDKAFITCGDNLIKHWDANTGNLIKSFNDNLNHQKYTLHYSYPFIAASDDIGHVYFWRFNYSEPIEQITVSHHKITSLQISAKDNLLTCVDETGKITTHLFHQVLKAKKMPLLDYCKEEQKINVSADSNYLLSNSSNTIYLHEIDSWQLLKTFTVNEGLEINCNAINKKGTLIVAGGRNKIPTSDSDVGFISINSNTSNEKKYSLYETFVINSVLITAYDQYLIYSNTQGNIVAWSLKEERKAWETSIFSDGNVTKISYSPKENLLVVLTAALSHPTITFLKIADGEIIGHYEINDQINQVLINHPGNYLLANNNEGGVYLAKRTLDLKRLLKFDLYSKKLDDLVMNKKGTIIAGACAAKSSILIWHRKDENLQLKTSIIHPDKPSQVFLFETSEAIKIISRSETGSVRCWTTPNVEPYQFRLLNEIGHGQLSLKGVKLDGTKKLSRDNLCLMHQLKAQGYPYVNSDRYYSQLKPDLNQVFYITDWQIAFQEEKSYLLLRSQQFKAVKIQLLIEQVKKITSVLSLALKKCFNIFKDINYLDLSDNNLGDLHMNLLASALQSEAGFEQVPLYQCNVLILSNNQISKNGLEILLEALVKKPSIKQLQMNHNYIDCSYLYLQDIVRPQIEKSNLVKLNLKFNFIPKGELTEENNIRLYANKDPLEKSPRPLRTLSKVTFFQPPISVSYYNAEIKVSTPPILMQVSSLLASFDQNNPNKKLIISQGIMGILIKRNRSTSEEHTYIILEGVSKFGQRYLILGDLFFKSRSEVITVQISQYTPQDFLSFINQSDNVFFKSALFTRKEMKRILKSLCNFRDKKGEFNSSLYSNAENNTSFHCALEILKAAGIEKEIEDWKVADDIERTSGCLVC